MKFTNFIIFCFYRTIILLLHSYHPPSKWTSISAYPYYLGDSSHLFQLVLLLIKKDSIGSILIKRSITVDMQRRGTSVHHACQISSSENLKRMKRLRSLLYSRIIIAIISILSWTVCMAVHACNVIYVSNRI